MRHVVMLSFTVLVGTGALTGCNGGDAGGSGADASMTDSARIAVGADAGPERTSEPDGTAPKDAGATEDADSPDDASMRADGRATDAADGGENEGDSGTTSTMDSATPNASKACSPVAPGDYEQYNLPPITSLASGLSSEVDWGLIPASGGWNGIQAMDSCRMKADGFLTWHGRVATRVEVDPNDDPLELGENTERAESYSFQDATGQAIVESGDQYYALSYYFPATWGGTQYPWHVFESSGSGWPYNTTSDCSSGNDCQSWSYVAQFHAADPPWGFLQAAATVPGGPQLYAFVTSGSSYAFSDGGKIALEKWTDFVIEINWSTGAINLWRRDEGNTAFTQVVSVVDDTAAQQTGVYFKQGLYRGGTVNGRVDIFWYGPSARGSSFAAVENAAFGTENGP